MLKITIYTLTILGLSTITGWLASMFMDVYTYTAMACSLAGIDVITGVFAAKKRGDEVTGVRMMDAIKKCVWYCTAIVMTNQVELMVFRESPIMLIRSIPLAYTINSYIVLKEFKSNIENVTELTGVKLNGPVGQLINLFFFINTRKRKTK